MASTLWRALGYMSWVLLLLGSSTAFAGRSDLLTGSDHRPVSDGISASLASIDNPSFMCGTKTTPNDVARAQAVFRNKFLVGGPHVERRQAPPQSYTFDVQWWVVTSDFTYDGGWVPDEQISAQMDMMNQAYAETGISWNHIGTGRILNRYWFEVMTTSTISHLIQMHSNFKIMRPDVLNVYTFGFFNEPLTNGASTLPVNYESTPILDGIMLRWDTLPGGSNPERQGSTLTHEAGHWLGLAHTFDGGCNGLNDGVNDTPAQANYTIGCPVGLDTCPGGGPDPIFNWMDYSDESCRREFTLGQIQLMHRSIQAFRTPLDSI